MPVRGRGSPCLREELCIHSHLCSSLNLSSWSKVAYFNSLSRGQGDGSTGVLTELEPQNPHGDGTTELPPRASKQLPHMLMEGFLPQLDSSMAHVQWDDTQASVCHLLSHLISQQACHLQLVL